jgi:HK97 family phage prohead protease
MNTARDTQPIERKALDATTIERKSVPFEAKALDEDAPNGGFSGVGAAYLNIDGVGDIIAPGAFKDGIEEYLASGFVGGLGHDWNSPIGHPAEASETDRGLYVKAYFDPTPAAQAVRAMMTPNPRTGRATVSRLSIGYKTMESRLLNGPDEVKAYWAGAGYAPTPTDLERAESGARLLTKLRLFEVSPVLIPANDLAQVTGAKSDVPAASASKPGFAETSRKAVSVARESLEGVESAVASAERRAALRLKEGPGAQRGQPTGADGLPRRPRRGDRDAPEAPRPARAGPRADPAQGQVRSRSLATRGSTRHPRSTATSSRGGSSTPSRSLDGFA